uniref:Potassium channel domain-containing protein n=1 Tax=Kalanchoe fedtschenkoi TaxID=63787 RepID=A0A7N0RE49_KALFE
MDEVDAKRQSAGVLIDIPLAPGKKAPKRRYRRSRSAPVADTDLGPQCQNDGSSPTNFEIILKKLHPSLRQVAMFLCVYLGVGTLCFYLVRDQIKGKKTNGVLDAVYFCIVTMTTVGYGDLVPTTPATKLLACAFVFTGMAMVGLLLSKSADYLVERQEILLVKAIRRNQKANALAITQESETNRIKYKCLTVFVILLVLMIIGTIFLKVVEKLSFVNSFYCVCSTITTLGYGDVSFTTKGGRVFAIFWVLSGTLCVAQFFLYIAQLSTEKRRKSLVKWVLNRQMTKLDLEAADFNGDGVVDAAEFVLYKLKEMGKINKEDIDLVMEEFEHLDVDQTGTLSASDITLAQVPDSGK